ncbi:MAG: LysR family transcriptional regulator [Vulcanimicrobiaceae bacterium]
MSLEMSDTNHRSFRSLPRTRFRELETFCVVARTLQITNAAEMLHYAQSSVTEQIHNLEADFGSKLFERTARGLRLTSSGERLLGYAERMLSLASEAKAALSSVPGEPVWLKLLAPETLCRRRLPAIITGLVAAHPQMSLELATGSRTELLRAVAAGTAHIAILWGDEPNVAGARCEPLGTEPLVLIADPSHQLLHAQNVSRRDLATQPFIVTRDGCAYRELYERTLVPAPTPAMELDSIATMVNCVALGLGLALLPRLAVEESIESGTVVALPLQGPPLFAGLWATISHSVPTSIADEIVARLRDNFGTAN